MCNVHGERQLLTNVGENLAEEADEELLDVFSGLLGDPCEPEVPSPLVGIQVVAFFAKRCIFFL